jgi:hypothetical protein
MADIKNPFLGKGCEKSLLVKMDKEAIAQLVAQWAAIKDDTDLVTYYGTDNGDVGAEYPEALSVAGSVALNVFTRTAGTWTATGEVDRWAFAYDSSDATDEGYYFQILSNTTTELTPVATYTIPADADTVVIVDSPYKALEDIKTLDAPISIERLDANSCDTGGWNETQFGRASGTISATGVYKEKPVQNMFLYENCKGKVYPAKLRYREGTGKPEYQVLISVSSAIDPTGGDNVTQEYNISMEIVKEPIEGTQA